MWRILIPLKYLTLHNAEKWKIDFVPTGLITALLALPFLLLPGANFFQSGGFLDKILPLSTALTAFYVAALVAVATFSHADLDKVITVGAVAEIVKDGEGRKSKRPLTRREFTCAVFAYLAFSCLIISVSIAVTIPVNDLDYAKYSLPRWFGWLLRNPQNGWLRIVGVVVYSAAVAHLVVVTCLGLYYLMDRINHRSPRVITRRDAA